MDSQLNLLVPIPIMEQIISFSTLADKLAFRMTCKQFSNFTTKQFFPTFTTTLCSNLLGHQDGKLMHAAFNRPYFGVLNASSTILYVSDRNNHVIRKIDLSTNQVTTLCGTVMNPGWKDGIGKDAQFDFPSGLALNEKENLLYISDSWNHEIRSVNLIDGRVTTMVGNSMEHRKVDGIGIKTTLYIPFGLAFDSISNVLYVAERNNHSIRRILLGEKRVETLCGNGKCGYKDGQLKEAMFNRPCDIVLNSETQELYVSDSWNHAIRIVSLKNRIVSTLCGTPKEEGYENGSAEEAKFYYPSGLGFNAQSQRLYVTDDNHVVREISLSKKIKVDTLCGIANKKGNKDGLLPEFNCLKGITIDSHTQSLYLMDHENSAIKKISLRKRGGAL